MVVSSELRFDTFLKYNTLITPNSRCCPVHIVPDSDSFTAAAVEKLHGVTVDNVCVNRTAILDLLEKMRTALLRNTGRLSFENMDRFEDGEVFTMTGLHKQQLLDLFQYVKPHIRSTPAREPLTTLVIFLMKMKSGISNSLLSALFSISKSCVRRAIRTVRQTLMLSFVDEHLGFQHVTREKVISDHTTVLAKSLFTENDDQVIIVLDGTYIFIQKSNHHLFQRRSYSVHKGRPLVKPMVIVSTTGYFISVLGPYLADGKNNDASILEHILRTNVESIKAWVKPNDVFVVDRGFRDALHLLDDLGIHAEMPCFMARGDKQMCTEDANSSRLVTKVMFESENDIKYQNNLLILYT